MRSPNRVLVVLLVTLCAGNVGVVFARSGIPYELRDRISHIEVRREKLPGVDDVWLVRLGERTIHLDREFAEELEEGDLLDKPAWSTQVEVPRGEIGLRPSRDVWGMVATILVVLGCVIVLQRRRVPRKGGPRAAL